MCLWIQNRGNPQPACKVGDMSHTIQERVNSFFNDHKRARAGLVKMRVALALFQSFSTTDAKRRAEVSGQSCGVDEFTTFKAVTEVIFFESYERGFYRD